MEQKTARKHLHSLRAEARLLGHLLKCYLHDRQISRAEPPERVAYFIDSHDIKAYIDPHRDDYLEGFMLEAERASGTGLTLEVKLKSEQILSHLLFANDDPIGLLPSHGEEIDEEVTYQHRNWMSNQIRLIDQARDQVQALRRRQLAGMRRPGATAMPQPHSKEQVLQFFQEAAPALMTLLRPAPERPSARIVQLIERSKLTPLSEMPWEQFELDRTLADRLRSTEPSQERIDRWQSFIESRGERKRNSNRANRIDAEALACIDHLNEQLAATPVRVRLVTRAMTLVAAAREHDLKNKGHDLDSAHLLRHPRLVFLGPKHESEEDAPAATLAVALDTYDKQLRAQAENADHDPRQAMANLLAAWHKFESARFTSNLRVDPKVQTEEGEHAIDDALVGKLLEWFQSDASFEDLISEDLKQAVRKFGTDTYRLTQTPAGMAIPARVVRVSPTRARVFPALTGVPGPVEFSDRAVLESPIRQPELEDLLDNLRDNDNPCERYLAWALLHACHQRPELAEIYAKSAIEMARLLPTPAMMAAANEARLLLAQLRRLGGLLESDARKRAAEALEHYREAAQLLGDIRDPRTTNDARVERELAAQILEACLTQPEELPKGPRFSEGLNYIEEALGASTQDALLRPRVLELALTYSLAAVSHPQRWPGAEAAVGRIAEWHGELHRILEEQREHQHIDEMSRRACALELIGFELARNVRTDAAQGSLSALLQQPSIPLHLRLGARDLLDQINSNKDETARLIQRHLRELVRRLERIRLRDLVLAPVWPVNMAAAIVQMVHHPQARALVERAYNVLLRLAGPQQELPVDDRDRESLDRAEADLAQALRLVREFGAGAQFPKAEFFLRMELAYTHMLLCGLLREGEKSHALEALLAEYASIVSDYPQAAVPHFRLNVIYSELEREEEAVVEINRAAELMTSDPFLGDGNHWVRSTILRRLAVNFSERARHLRQRMREDPRNLELKNAYVDALKKALSTVYEGFGLTSGDLEQDYLARLERIRRANNVVYCGALLYEAAGSLETVADTGFDLDKLKAVLEQLHPETIEEVDDRALVHTIGYAYHVLGDANNARRAADRLIELLKLSGADPRDKQIASLISDAFHWSRSEDGWHDPRMRVEVTATQEHAG